MSVENLEIEETKNEQENNVGEQNQEILSSEKEREIYMELKNDVMKKGDTYYLICSEWWSKWRDYIGWNANTDENKETVRPSEIDNSSLLDENGLLIKEMQEHNNYMIISEPLWKKLHSWYGGGPEIQRKVISDLYNRLSIEVRLLTIKFIKSSDIENVVFQQFSKTSKVREVTTAICEKMGLKENDVRLWDFHNERKLKILTDPYETMEEARIINNQKILIEEKKNGKFEKLSENQSREPTTPGLCGLQNLGNTCYMNSGIQCLSNITPISDYLIKKKFVEEINTVNPIGTHGELINEFAELITEIWSGECSSIGPKDFKFKLEKFAPQFSGYNQQDSHEFISSLLDGLHEDVNRIKQKKYSEGDDNETLSDLENSQLSWKTHRERNDSFIVDWFHGQLKSTIKCPKCPKVSVKFDPMMYLQLPLPQKTTREIKVLVIPSDLNIKPSYFLISVPKDGSIEDVKKQIALLSNQEPPQQSSQQQQQQQGEGEGEQQQQGEGEGERMERGKVEAGEIEICDVYNHKFFKIFKNNEPQSSIQDRDVIHAYCLSSPLSPSPPSEDDKQEHIPFVSVIVIHKAMDLSPPGNKSSSSTFGSPLIMKVASKIKYSELRKEMFSKLQRIIKVKDAIPFHIRLANEYGEEKKDFEDDDDVLLENRSVLVVAWGRENLQDVYDEAEAKNVGEHPSMNPESNTKKENTVNIEKCLHLFSVEEQLDPENEWYCNKCKEHQRAYKKIDIWSLPKILVIQLKRFSYKNIIFREKLETYVDFPLEDLDLSHIVQGPFDPKEAPVYDLIGISQHFGVLGGGHYTAVAKNPNTKKWYSFDDKHVSETSEKKIKSSAAYLLFYQRKDTIDKDFVLGNNTNTNTDENSSPVNNSGDDKSDNDNN